MGQSSSSHHGSSKRHQGWPLRNDLPPLKFHQKKGENIELLRDGIVAKRHESFCKGIVFSDRPVAVGERICIRLSEMDIRWSGVLRVGFSAHDPRNLPQLPKYACPDLTSREGYWAKALSERYAEAEAKIHYYVSGNGDVHFGVNGEDRGVFFTGVDTRQPLWAMIDLYGNCTSIELMDPRRNLNNFSRNSSDTNLPQLQINQLSQSPSRLGPFQATAPPSLRVPTAPAVVQRPQVQLDAISRQLNGLNLTENLPPIVAHHAVAFEPLRLHSSVGRNAHLTANNTIAWRHEDEFAQGYVFTSLPVKPGERLALQVLGTEDSYIGSLAFGMTNCDPARINVKDLPEDSDLLLDRPEYWVVSKDVANAPKVGDELSFIYNFDGSIGISKNGGPISVFMHVDTSLRLWAFWDVYGNTSKIRILGWTPIAQQRQHRISPDEPVTECTVCCENTADSVLYTCGHICMCYQCALQQWKGRGGGFCPICRHPIRDVIKTFRS